MSFKKILLSLILSVTLSFSLIIPISTPVYAEGGPQDACSVAGVDDPLICGTKGSNEEKELQNRIKNILETVYLWIGIIAVIVIVIGGIKYMTSNGEAEKIKGAKNAITYAIIGLVVTLAAFAITEFFIGALEGNAPDGGYSEGGGGGGDSPAPGEGGDSPAPGEGGDSPAPGEEVVEVKFVQVMGISTIKKGNEYGFYVKIIPDYATNKTVTWTSSNTDVATISETGRVKAIAPGETTITATSTNGKIGSKTVKVPEPIVATGVTITSKVTSLTTGKTAQLKATIVPANAEDKKLEWLSSDSKIVSVSDNGFVKAIKKGTAAITAKTVNGKSDSVTIRVEDAAEVVTANKVKKLQDTVKTYAWPTFRGSNHNTSNPYANQKDAYTSAYKAAASSFVSNHDCRGNDCGVFVLITMRNSGWEPNYPDQRTGGQYEWLSNPSHGWEDVTSKIKSNADAKPGDVIITRGQGHVLLYMGKIDGFSSKMASASYCDRTPMADSASDISHYVNHPHGNGKRYAIFRKKNP